MMSDVCLKLLKELITILTEDGRFVISLQVYFDMSYSKYSKINIRSLIYAEHFIDLLSLANLGCNPQ